MIGTSGRQVSGVLAGHQDLASWASLELDAQLADRRARKTNAFSVTAPATYFGQVNLPVVRSYAITPSLHLRPGGGWEATLEATHGESATVSTAMRYTNGALLVGRTAYDDYLTNTEASAEGPLVRLPGGDVRLALGGGYRRFRLAFNVRATSGGVTQVMRDAVERRESRFGYGELSVPLVGAANRMPLVDALRLGDSESDLVRAIRESAQQGTSRASDQIVMKNLNVQPTIKVRPGWPLRVVVHKDIVLAPWPGQEQ